MIDSWQMGAASNERKQAIIFLPRRWLSGFRLIIVAENDVALR
jgi:hypothetical protein